MIERRDDDLITRRDIRASPGARDEIQRFRRAAGEDETIRIFHTEKPRDAKPGVVITLGRMHGKRVGTAMRIGVARFVEIANRIEHYRGLL
jgi:hypothetical protein